MDQLEFRNGSSISHRWLVREGCGWAAHVLFAIINLCDRHAFCINSNMACWWPAFNVVISLIWDVLRDWSVGDIISTDLNSWMIIHRLTNLSGIYSINYSDQACHPAFPLPTIHPLPSHLLPSNIFCRRRPSERAARPDRHPHGVSPRAQSSGKKISSRHFGGSGATKHTTWHRSLHKNSATAREGKTVPGNYLAYFERKDDGEDETRRKKMTVMTMASEWWEWWC